jgi:hypothetical protein
MPSTSSLASARLAFLSQQEETQRERERVTEERLRQEAPQAGTDDNGLDVSSADNGSVGKPEKMTSMKRAVLVKQLARDFCEEALQFIHTIPVTATDDNEEPLTE